MISNETLYHKNPETGEKQVIGLGWLDDSMKMIGPTEEDKNYIADTCGSNTSQVIMAFNCLPLLELANVFMAAGLHR